MSSPGCAPVDPKDGEIDGLAQALHQERLKVERLTARLADVERRLALSEGVAPASDTDMFYLLDTRSVVGNCTEWWRPNGGGYTCNLSEAGLYSREEAPHHRETDVPVSRALAESLVVWHVRIEPLRERVNIKEYERTQDYAAREAWLAKHFPPLVTP